MVENSKNVGARWWEMVKYFKKLAEVVKMLLLCVGSI